MATWIWYGNGPLHLAKKRVDWESDDIRVMLLGSGYVPNQDTHDYVDDVVASEVVGTNYVAGGNSPGSRVLVYDAVTNEIRLTCSTVSWPNSTITASFAVLYNRTPATDATRPLLGYLPFGSALSSSGTTFEIPFSSGYPLRITAT